MHRFSKTSTYYEGADMKAVEVLGSSEKASREALLGSQAMQGVNTGSMMRKYVTYLRWARP